MPISPELLNHLRDTLARCSALASDRELRALFIDTRLAPWLNRIPENTPDRAAIEDCLLIESCHVHKDDHMDAHALLRVSIAVRQQPFALCTHQLPIHPAKAAGR
jgi:hypothetical protein